MTYTNNVLKERKIQIKFVFSLKTMQNKKHLLRDSQRNNNLFFAPRNLRNEKRAKIRNGLDIKIRIEQKAKRG